MTPADPFPGRDQTVTGDGEPDDELQTLMNPEVGEGDTDAVEPLLDE
jgi:hypothetical protein